MSNPRDPLTPEQIKHWRDMLVGMFGPWAFIMPEEDIQRMREHLQSDLDSHEINDSKE
jgi:hypothetical protein